MADEAVDRAIALIARARVGGTFWGPRPPLPDAPYTLVRSSAGTARAERLRSLPGENPMLLWSGPAAGAQPIQGMPTVTGPCDPWHMVSGASSVIADADDDLALIAALAGVNVEPVGEGRFSALGSGPAALRAVVRDHLLNGVAYANPFTGEAMRFADAVELCAFWKDLIDGNRPIAAAFGFAAWKRTTSAPLLWSGAQDSPFAASLDQIGSGDEVVVWKTRADPASLDELERRHVSIIEAEDGFIRSIGLGANCVPPLSLVVDRRGIYFDPSRPSDLEIMIQQGNFAPDLVARAGRLVALIAEFGVSKYAVGRRMILRRPVADRVVLVTGQVEDDRSVQCGGGDVTSNLELLRRARADAPGAYIIYKPHPDVEAGHRVGAIASRIALEYADDIVTDQPITALIELADEVHVNTSLAGFEALLRGKPVTTHGVPFYAGWGLTRDLGAVPGRRTARPTIDELAAAVLLSYPRYLDPTTGLPCTAEILVRRLADGGQGRQASPLVALRRWQGAWRRRLGALRKITR